MLIAQKEPAKGTIVQPPNVVESGWNVLDLLLLLTRRRRWIATFTVGVGVVTAIVSFLLPLRYTGTTSVLPPQQPASGGSFLSQVTGSTGLAALAGSGLGMKSQLDMYVSMFRSRTVEERMVTRFHLQQLYHAKKVSDARETFEKRSTVVAGVKDGIIRVTVDGPTPEQAAMMTNAYVEEFQKLASGVAVTEAAQRRLFFDQQLEEAKDRLSAAEQDLKKTELSTGMVQPDSQSRAMIESAAVLQGQIAAKEVQLQALSSYATVNNPEVVVAQRELQELRSQLSRFTGNTDSVSDLFVPKGKVPEAALDYVRKLREVKYRETIFQALASQYQLAKLDEAKQGAIFQVIDRAEPPDKRSSPHRAVLVILFTTLALVGSCLWVWLQAAYKEMLSDPEDGPRLAALRSAFRR